MEISLRAAKNSRFLASVHASCHTQDLQWCLLTYCVFSYLHCSTGLRFHTDDVFLLIIL